jgi:hypothetical protein
MTLNRSLAIVFLPFFLAVLPVFSQQNPSAPLGKQRAAGSPLEWEIREAAHPALGNIRFAFLKTPLETSVGTSKVYSRAYLSCQKGLKKFAIELTNTSAPDDTGGLKPLTMPRLMCNRPENGKVVREELLTNWEVSKIGDVLVRGFRAFPLRECVSIDVAQEVTLPAGWATKSAKIEFEILPYARELDAIFVACGDVSAYAPEVAPAPAVAVASSPAKASAPPAPAIVSAPTKPAVVAAPPKPTVVAAPPKPTVAAAPAARPTPPPLPPPAPVASAPAPGAVAPWQEARTTATGQTHVRADASVQSPIVTTLYPGSVILVQRTGSDWWRVKMSGNGAPQGYIREDRLVIK